MTSQAPSLAEQVPAELEGWLTEALAEAEPPLRFTRIAGGFSMLTWRFEDQAGHGWVLRHRPPGTHQGRAHDTAREARAIGARSCARFARAIGNHLRKRELIARAVGMRPCGPAATAGIVVTSKLAA